jgi:hypothetical protein
MIVCITLLQLFQVGQVKHGDEKVYTMDTSGYRLVVGTSSRKMYIYDVRLSVLFCLLVFLCV